MIIFLDESGDLGFDFANKNPSDYFSITLLVCDSFGVERQIRKARIRTLKGKLNHKKRSEPAVELKGSRTSLSVKNHFLDCMPDSGWGLYNATLDKRKLVSYPQGKQGKSTLYNSIAYYVVGKVVFPRDLRALSMVIDKGKSKSEIQEFDSGLRRCLQLRLPSTCNLSIVHRMSHTDPGLQAVDMFCYGFSQKYKEEYAWYQRYKPFVMFDQEYLPELPSR